MRIVITLVFYRFPYFLCANTKDEFMLQNISKITSSILIHSKANHLKKLECYKSQSELIEVSFLNLDLS